MKLKLPVLKENTQNMLSEAAVTLGFESKVSVNFSVKNATVSHSSKSSYFDLKSNISSKDDYYGYIVVSFDIDSKVKRFSEYTPEDLSFREKSILALMEYWRGYKQLKGLKRIFFRFSEKALGYIDWVDNTDLIKIPAIENLFSGIYMSETSPLFREGCADVELEKMIDLTKEVEEIKIEIPTFSANKKSHTGFYGLWATVFYYENKYFKLRLVENDVVAIDTNDNNHEIARIPFEKGVIRKILHEVEEHAKLYNLLHPPIKNFKSVIKEYFLLQFDNRDDSTLEDMVRHLEEQLTVGKVEDEFVEIQQLLESARREGTKPLDKSEILKKFLLSEEEVPVLTEHFQGEFNIYRFKTKNNFWFFMFSEVKKNAWVFISQEETLPKEAQDAAFLFVEERRNVSLMQEVESVLLKLQDLEGKCNSTKLYYPVTDASKRILRAANLQFGTKWKEVLLENNK